ncbi:MAG: hypothetical protein KKE50_07220 [Nanoarchaeota archaeon]|nr:hypothetical protein [Nanoarchaeota archaeon]
MRHTLRNIIEEIAQELDAEKVAEEFVPRALIDYVLVSMPSDECDSGIIIRDADISAAFSATKNFPDARHFIQYTLRRDENTVPRGVNVYSLTQFEPVFDFLRTHCYRYVEGRSEDVSDERRQVRVRAYRVSRRD